MALVKVVLPWSMWPMVPTFTCGFVRTKVSFAICYLLLRFSCFKSCGLYNLFGYIFRDLLVKGGFHGIGCPTLSKASDDSSVSEHLSQRGMSAYHLDISS